MQKLGKYALLIIIVAFLVTPARARDKFVCAICGKDITDTVVYFTDEITGQKVDVCPDCAKLPYCFICGLPVNDDGIALPDGRHLCTRDKKTAVLTATEAQQVASDVLDRLQRLFVRYTMFPTNVDVSVID